MQIKVSSAFDGYPRELQGTPACGYLSLGISAFKVWKKIKWLIAWGNKLPCLKRPFSNKMMRKILGLK